MCLNEATPDEEVEIQNVIKDFFDKKFDINAEELIKQQVEYARTKTKIK